MGMKLKYKENDTAGIMCRKMREREDQRNCSRMNRRYDKHHHRHNRDAVHLGHVYVVFLLVAVRFHLSMASFCPTITAGGNPIVVRFPSSSSPREIRADHGYDCHHHATSGDAGVLPGLRRIRVGRNNNSIRRGYITRAYLANKKSSWGNPFSSNDNDNNEKKAEETKDKEKKDSKSSKKVKDKTDDSIKNESSSPKSKKKGGKIARFVNAVLRRPDDAQSPTTKKKSKLRENAVAAIEEKLTSVRLELSSLRGGSKPNKIAEPAKRETVNRLEQILASLEERRKELLDGEREKRAVRELKKEERKRKAAERKRRSKLDGVGNDKNTTNPVLDAIGGAQSFVISAWESNVAKRAEWIPVCPITQIAPGIVLPVQAGGIDLLIAASKNGLKLHCIANSCPHLGTPLETGPLERRKVENRMIGPKQESVSGGLPTTSLKRIPPDKDGCEECIVCPLHKTAFALESGEVRGEWCPYPPILGKLVGSNKSPETTKLPTFELRTRGKNVEVRINSRINK